MKILVLGDVVGRTARNAIADQLPGLIDRLGAELVIINGENAAGGFGITEPIFDGLLEAGADVVTTGNHVWNQREALTFADRRSGFLRPANYPAGTPGRGTDMFEAKNGARIMVANIMGRLFVQPELDDPFACGEALLENVVLGSTVDAIIVDFHAEATSEKQCFAHFVDGRVSAVVGTHTHVPTADHHILGGGTAYMSDLGMCGDYDSSLGMEKEEPINRFVTKVPKAKLDAATGEATLCGAGIIIDDDSGLATHIAPLRVGPRLENVMPW